MADSKITALPALTTPTSDDLVAVVDNADTTTKKSTLEQVFTADAQRPTAGQKAALVGTSGTPGALNPYVTDADSRNSDARDPNAHAASHEGGSDPLSIDALLPTQTGHNGDVLTSNGSAASWQTPSAGAVTWANLPAGPGTWDLSGGDMKIANGNVLPAADNTQDAGSSSFQWKTVYVGTSVIIGANTIDANKAAALAGTSGTPSSSNKYVTDSDTRLSGISPYSLDLITKPFCMAAATPQGVLPVAFGMAALVTISGTLGADATYNEPYTIWTSTASSGASAGFYGPSNAFRFQHLPDFYFIIRTTDDITNVRYLIGFGTGFSASSDDPAGSYCYMRYSTTAGDGGWVGVTDNGTTNHVSATVASFAANTRYIVRVRAVSTSSVKFSINGGTEVEMTADLMTGSTQLRLLCAMATLSNDARIFRFARFVGWFNGSD